MKIPSRSNVVPRQNSIRVQIAIQFTANEGDWGMSFDEK